MGRSLNSVLGTLFIISLFLMFDSRTYYAEWYTAQFGLVYNDEAQNVNIKVTQLANNGHNLENTSGKQEGCLIGESWYSRGSPSVNIKEIVGIVDNESWRRVHGE